MQLLGYIICWLILGLFFIFIWITPQMCIFTCPELDLFDKIIYNWSIIIWFLIIFLFPVFMIISERKDNYDEEE